MKVHYVTVAADMLERAGHRVTPAGGVPGLWNVEGIGNDLTTAQLLEVAGKRGMLPPMHFASKLRINNLS
jgi:hypothetical protein